MHHPRNKMVALLRLDDPFLPHDAGQSTTSARQPSSIYSKTYMGGPVSSRQIVSCLLAAGLSLFGGGRSLIVGISLVRALPKEVHACHDGDRDTDDYDDFCCHKDCFLSFRLPTVIPAKICHVMAVLLLFLPARQPETAETFAEIAKQHQV